MGWRAGHGNSWRSCLACGSTWWMQRQSSSSRALNLGALFTPAAAAWAAFAGRQTQHVYVLQYDQPTDQVLPCVYIAPLPQVLGVFRMGAASYKCTY